MPANPGTKYERDALLLKDKNWLSRSYRNKILLLTAILCLLGFAIVGVFPHVFYYTLSASDYLVLHIAAEILSVIVSYAVFVVGWQGYKQAGNKQDLIIGITFLAVGIIDFMHTLSYKGMPAFLSPNTVTKASTFWIAGRLVGSLGILFALFSTSVGRRRWSAGLALSIGLAIPLALMIAVTYYPTSLPLMFKEGVGQTPVKITLEWLVIGICAISVYLIGKRNGRSESAIILQVALVTTIFSEFAFTLYTSAFDTYNLMGHIYKVAAYYFIFKSLFVSSFSRPYKELIQARHRVESSFSRIGKALASGQEVNEVLELIAGIARDMLQAGDASVILVTDGELKIQAHTAKLGGSDVIDKDRTTAGEAIRTRQPVIVEDVWTIPGHSAKCHCQRLSQGSANSVLSAPIISDNDVLGVVEVYAEEAGAFGEKDAQLLDAFAKQAAIAIRNSINTSRVRAVAETLQLALLPSPPSVEGLDIAAKYVGSDDLSRVGGDLYDVFLLDQHHLAIVIGDVSGHGLGAASVMAMTEYMLKGFLINGMAPDQALQHVNIALCKSLQDKVSTFVTAFVGVIDLPDRTLTYCNAGHHMPILLNNACTRMDSHAGLPLGVFEAVSYENHTQDLSQSTGLLLYTDGVIESRNQGELFGERRLCELCLEYLHEPAKELLEEIVNRARNWSGLLQDDIALLAVKWGSSDKKENGV